MLKWTTIPSPIYEIFSGNKYIYIFDTETTGLIKEEDFPKIVSYAGIKARIFRRLEKTENNNNELTLILNGKYFKTFKYEEKISDNEYILNKNHKLFIKENYPLIYNTKTKKYEIIFPIGDIKIEKEINKTYFTEKEISPEALSVHKIYNKEILKKQLTKKNEEEVFDFFKRVFSKFLPHLIKQRKRILEILNNLDKINNSKTESIKQDYIKKLETINQRLVYNLQILSILYPHQNQKRKEKSLYEEITGESLKTPVIPGNKTQWIEKLFEWLEYNKFIEIKNTQKFKEDVKFQEKINKDFNSENIVPTGHNIYSFDIPVLEHNSNGLFNFKNEKNLLDTMYEYLLVTGEKKPLTLDGLNKKSIDYYTKFILKQIKSLKISNEDIILAVKLLEKGILLPDNFLNQITAESQNEKTAFNYIKDLNEILKLQEERLELHDALLDIKINLKGVEYLITKYLNLYGFEDPLKIYTQKITKENVKKNIKIPYIGIVTHHSKGSVTKLQEVINFYENNKNKISGVIISDKIMTDTYNQYNKFKKHNYKFIPSLKFKIKDLDSEYNDINIIFKDKRSFESIKLLPRNYVLTMQDLEKILEFANVAVLIHPKADNIFPKNEKIFVKISPNIIYDYENANFSHEPMLWIGNRTTFKKTENAKHYVYNKILTNAPFTPYDFKKVRQIYPNLQIPTPEELQMAFPYEKFKKAYDNANNLIETSENINPVPEHIKLFPTPERFMKLDKPLKTPEDYEQLLNQLLRQDWIENRMPEQLTRYALKLALQKEKKILRDKMLKKQKITEEEKRLMKFLENFTSVDSFDTPSLKILLKEIEKDFPTTLHKTLYQTREELKNKTVERIKYEKESLKQFENYELVFTYYFITRYIYKEAKKVGLALGPGRGSAAGSEINNVMGVTSYPTTISGLLFERFLNPERVSLPDVDIDTASKELAAALLEKIFKPSQEDIKEWFKKHSDIYIPELVDYALKNKEFTSTTKVLTVSYITDKTAIFDIFRLLGLRHDLLNEARKYFDEKKSIEENILGNPILKDRYLPKTLKEIAEIANELVGLKLNEGRHAGAVLISELIAQTLEYLTEDSTSTDKRNPRNEAKMDMLGLITLKIISEMELELKKIQKQKSKLLLFVKKNKLERAYEELKKAFATNPEFYSYVYKNLPEGLKEIIDKYLDGYNNKEEIYNNMRKILQAEKATSVLLPIRLLTFDDLNVYKTLKDGKTASVFQVENEGLTRLLKDLMIGLGFGAFEAFKTLIAALALYRPGPLETGDVNKFVIFVKNKIREEFKNYYLLNKEKFFNNFENLTKNELEMLYKLLPNDFKKIYSYQDFISIIKTESYYQSGLFRNKILNELKDILPLKEKIIAAKKNKSLEEIFEYVLEEINKMKDSKEKRDSLKEIEKIFVEKCLVNSKKPVEDTIKEAQKIEEEILNDPDYAEIMKSTYGVMVYQEQIMFLGRLAGFTQGESDKLRKAIGKKIMEMIIEYRDKMTKGLTRTRIKKITFKRNGKTYKITRNKEYEYIIHTPEGKEINISNVDLEVGKNEIEFKIKPQKLDKVWPLLSNDLKNENNKSIIVKREEIEDINQYKPLSNRAAQYLYDSIIGFGAYAFNLSHSNSYAGITYKTALIKTYFPEIFFMINLKYSSKKAINALINEMKREYPYKLRLYDLNNIKNEFTLKEDEQEIYLPPSVLKNVKDLSIDMIEYDLKLSGKNFNSLVGLFLRTGIDKTTFKVLGSLGLFKEITDITDKAFWEKGGEIFEEVKKESQKIIKEKGGAEFNRFFSLRKKRLKYRIIQEKYKNTLEELANLKEMLNQIENDEVLDSKTKEKTLEEKQKEMEEITKILESLEKEKIAPLTKEELIEYKTLYEKYRDEINYIFNEKIDLDEEFKKTLPQETLSEEEKIKIERESFGEYFYDERKIHLKTLPKETVEKEIRKYYEQIPGNDGFLFVGETPKILVILDTDIYKPYTISKVKAGLETYKREEYGIFRGEKNRKEYVLNSTGNTLIEKNIKSVEINGNQIEFGEEINLNNNVADKIKLGKDKYNNIYLEVTKEGKKKKYKFDYSKKVFINKDNKKDILEPESISLEIKTDEIKIDEVLEYQINKDKILEEILNNYFPNTPITENDLAVMTFKIGKEGEGISLHSKKLKDLIGNLKDIGLILTIDNKNKLKDALKKCHSELRANEFNLDYGEKNNLGSLFSGHLIIMPNINGWRWVMENHPSETMRREYGRKLKHLLEEVYYPVLSDIIVEKDNLEKNIKKITHKEGFKPS